MSVPAVAGRSPALPPAVEAELALCENLGAMGGLDREQLLAWQLAKLVGPGARVIDVGAHSGLHAAPLLDRIGPLGELVLAEPQPEMHARYLRPVFGLHPNCVLFHGAVADRPGRSAFHVVVGAEQESGLRPKSAYVAVPRGAPVVVEVEVTTLDALAGDRRVDLVKVDVEGAELLVLEGGRATLAERRPVVALEASSFVGEYGGTPGALHDLAGELGYALTTVLGTPLDRADFEVCVASGRVWDFLLLPRERAEALAALLRAPRSPLGDGVRVDLRATVPLHARGVAGFSGVESWGRWTDARLAPEALVHLARPLPPRAVLELVVLGIHAEGTPFDLVAGEDRRRLTAPGGRLGVLSATFERAAPAEVLAVRPLRTVAVEGGARRLGVGVQSIRVRAAGRAG